MGAGEDLVVAGSVSPGGVFGTAEGGHEPWLGGKPLLKGCSSVAFASSCAVTTVPFPCALSCAGTGCLLPVPSLLLPFRLSLVDPHEGSCWGGWAWCQGSSLFLHGELVVVQVSRGTVATTMACWEPIASGCSWGQ